MNGYKMQTTYLLVVFAIVVQHTFAQTVSSLIQKCKVSDPKFDECVLSSANNFISAVLNGNEKYGIPPPKDDLPEDSIEILNATDKFNLKFINVSSNSFRNFAIQSIHFDFKKKMLTFWGKVAPYLFTFSYEADGEILGKPVHESGKANMTFEQLDFVSMVTLDFKMKNDKKYLEAVSCILTINTKNFQFKPYNQMIVGEPMTAEQKLEFQSYINQVPAKMKEEIETYDKYIIQILNIVFESQPFEDIFLP